MTPLPATQQEQEQEQEQEQGQQQQQQGPLRGRAQALLPRVPTAGAVSTVAWRCYDRKGRQ
jgi:hypothetical protein